MKKKWVAVWILVALLILSGVGYLIYRTKQNSQSLNEEKAANVALIKNTGKMCSAYSTSQARALLGSDVNVEASSFPAGFVGAVDGSQLKPLVDNCRYIGKTNNTRYLYLMGQLYLSEQDAKADFQLQKQRLLDAKNVDPTGYGDEMMYYGGAYFIRSKDVIISVSINKPEVASADQEAFTKKLLDEVYPDMLSILQQ